MNRPSNLSEILNMPMGGKAAPAHAPQSEVAEIEPVEESPSPPAVGFEDLSPLPRPGDPYKAYGSPARGAIPTLHMLFPDGTNRGFAYANYDSVDLLQPDEPGDGPILVIRFAGLFPCEVRIKGRGLDKLHNYLSYLRIPWIRELPKGGSFSKQLETVIRSADIKVLER